ncbi:MAG: glycosyltransferase family 4 protein [Elainellaceae cyanobacterium]
MTLAGANILIDGYNLELLKGTGIKTYGISLVRALQQLGANTDILFSRDVGRTKNPVLDEILFFDTMTDSSLLDRFDIFRKGRVLARGAMTAGGRVYQATPVRTSSVVLKNPVPGTFVGSLAGIIDSVQIFNLRNCYENANSMFKLAKLYTSVSLEKQIDVFHATYPLPMTLKGAKKITTIHDLIPLRLPYTTLDNKRVFYRLVQQTLKESDAIATVSENSKQDILSLFDVDPDKIQVTYQPVALKPLADRSAATVGKYLKKFQLTHQRYILFVGAIEPKKNVGRLIDAYAGIDTDIPLVIVGKRGWLWEDEIGKVLDDAEQNPLSKRVRLLQYVTSEDLRYLYSGALCFAFPSLYEGFGLPPLEAMTFDCPVLTSSVSSLPEICGDAALYADPYDVNAIRDQLLRLLEDANLRQQLIEAGRRRSQFFSADNYADRLSKLYSRVI